MAMASSSGTRCEIDVEVDSPNRNITPFDLNGECLVSRDGAKIKVRDEGVAVLLSSCSKLFLYIGGCCSGAESSPESSPERSWYYSERIQRMIERRGDFKSDVESEIESSKDHWSQVEATTLEREQTRKTNREYFEVLKRRKYVWEGDQIVAKQCIDEDEVLEFNLFTVWDDLEVGEKLAEGGQAEIYTVKYLPYLLLKVFKEGSVLQELEKQWPLALLKFHQFDEFVSMKSNLKITLRGATLLSSETLGWEDRFAFVMPRCWGDLRTLIDQQMIQSLNQGPPFTPLQVLHLMCSIAWDMMMLHSQQPPILHNDLKAANVLVSVKVERGLVTGWDKPGVDKDGMYDIVVADYECLVGVVGTGFWRAPEILQQLKNKVPASKLVFSEQCDVYSYGMTCYELVSGHIPFENEVLGNEGWDLVLKGERPELPCDLDGMIKEIIISCWDPIPTKRSTFNEIWWILESSYRKLVGRSFNCLSCS